MSDRGNTDGATRRRVKATGPTPTAGASPGIANGVNLRHASVASASKPPRRRKASSYPRRTWTIPLAIILGFFFLYALNPTESNVVHRFLFLSYKLDRNDGGPQHYAKGIWDIAYVVFFTCVLSFTREFIMYEMLQPLARLLKIQPLGKQLRFMEQMYTAVYIAFIGPLGVYCMKHSPVWYFNTAGMYEGFPHKTHTADLKFYYLFQAAFWLQQVLVMILGVEKRRKDFRELVCHHIVTIALIGLSYRFHFAYMGIAVYLTHDISDFFLAISKCLNYLDSPLQGPSFALCIAVWVYLRHYINLRILWSVLTEFKTVGPYELDWAAEQYKCPLANVTTFSLLAALQALNLFWLYCLLRSAYKFVFKGIAKDDRSDNDEPVKIDVATHPLETAESLTEVAT